MSVFEFDDYRELLRHLYSERKLHNKNFSYRYFSRVAGFASPNFLKRVMDGESKLSEKSIKKFIKGFKLEKEEGHFFRNLVLLNQSKTVDEKQIHAKEILLSKSYREIFPLGETQYDFFSNWYNIAVREVVNMPTFRERPEWIAKTVVPAITPKQAQGALDTLIKLGLLIRGKGGKLVQASANLTTPDEVISSSLARCHRDLMQRAAESIDTVPRGKRDISSVTVGVSEENVKKIKDLIQKFRREVLQLVSGDQIFNTVYQLNLQLFPIADAGKDDA